MSLQGSGLPITFKGVSFVSDAISGNDPELGTVVYKGGNEYVFAYNGGNSEIYPGYGVVLQSGATNYTMTVSAVTSADFVVGVVKHATIPTANYGFVVRRGFVNIEMGATSGSVASRGLVEIGANGVFVPVSNTTGNGPVIGQALAAIVSSASGAAFVTCY